MENTAQLELLELIGDLSNQLSEFKEKYLEGDAHINLDISANEVVVHIHTWADHACGLRMKRMLGIEDAEKINHAPENPWHYMKGKMSPKVEVRIYCQGLPPMCRIETYEEEIPKEQVVQLAETVKVKRTRICCGEGK